MGQKRARQIAEVKAQVASEQARIAALSNPNLRYGHLFLKKAIALAALKKSRQFTYQSAIIVENRLPWFCCQDQIQTNA